MALLVPTTEPVSSLATGAEARPDAGGVTLRLRHSEERYDPLASGVGLLVAELTNRTSASVVVAPGYDGVRTRLLGLAGRFPMVLTAPDLVPRGENAKRKAGRDNCGPLDPGPVPERMLVVGPGESRAVFELPAREVFFQLGHPEGVRWVWGWSPPGPRGVPTASPIHARAGSELGWEVSFRDEGTLWAEVAVGETLIASEKITLPVRVPRFEDVELTARCTSARYLPPDRLRFEFHFVPIAVTRGRLAPDERTFELPEGNGQHLLARLHPRRRGETGEYDCDRSVVTLRFLRVRDVTGSARLVLHGYEVGSAR